MTAQYGITESQQSIQSGHDGKSGLFVDSDGHRPELSVGTRVDVRTRFEPGRWVRGFTVAEVREDGYRIRRVSDNVVLEEAMWPHEVRPVSGLTRSDIGAKRMEGQ